MSYRTNNPRETNQQQQAPPPPFTTGAFQPQTLPPPQPETFILECNRLTSRHSSETSEMYNTNHRWITEFASGFQIREGDEIRINSAFLSSIGVGDLIAWNTEEGDQAQDNKANIIYSFYTSNDGLNDKREGYNMTTNNGGGVGKFPFDTDNTPCELMRVQKTLDTIANRTDAGDTFSYMEDPYLPCRFFGETFTIKTPVLNDNLYIEIHPELTKNNGSNGGTCLKIKKYTGADTLSGYLDLRNRFPTGATILLQAQTQPNITANHDQYNNPLLNYCFTIMDIVQEQTTNDWIICVEDQSGLCFNKVNPMTNGVRTITASIRIAQLQAKGSLNEDFNYSTALYEDDTNYLEVGDELTHYFTGGLPYDLNVDAPNTPTGTFTQVNDANTSNLPLTAIISTSPCNKSDTEIPIKIISLTNPIVPEITKKIQYITWCFEDSNIKSDTHTLQDLITFNGDCATFMLKLENEAGDTELVSMYPYHTDSTAPTPENLNIVFDTDNTNGNYISFAGCKRSVQLNKGNYFTEGQVGFNILPETITKASFIKMGNFFKDLTAHYSHNSVKQYQSTSLDYSTNTGTRTAVPQYCWIKTNQDQSVATLQIFTNESNNAFYSSRINIGTTTDSGSIFNTPVIYSGFQDLSSTLSEVKHYQSFQFEIDEPYSSPSDIATALTKQTHDIGEVLDKDGNIVSDIANTGLIQNPFFIPVWTSFNDQNVEQNNASPELGGTLDEGSYFLKYTLYKSSKSHFSANTFQNAGEYKIYFRTKHTSINKPVPYGSPAQLPPDFDQSANPQFAKTFGQTNTEILGFPIQYVEGKDCFVSQYAGSNNITFSWDDQNSRFKIDFLHQPAISKFEASSSGVVQEGGNIIAQIYYPAPQGQDGYLYKKPRTRCGGVNIENYVSYRFERGMTPNQVRQLANLDPSTDLSTDWFLNGTQNRNPVGKRFWNKLGFNDSQILTNNVGSTTDTTSGQYVPLGTTDNLIDCADALITAKEPAENTPYYYSTNKWDASMDNDEPAQYQYSSVGSLQFNNHLTGYGLPNTSGLPLQFRSNSTDLTKTPFSEYDSTYNPDRERNTAYTFQTDGDPLEAKDLPIKTEYPYFFVLSDIVKSNFYTSINNGSGLNAIGIISKLNAEQDFYFQYQAPQSFYAKKDMLISSITTEIRTPNLSVPANLSPYSSVIYQITRYAPKPITLSAPIWYQQEQFFNKMEMLIKQMVANTKAQPKQSEKEQISDIMSQVAQAVERPTTEGLTLPQRIINNWDRLQLDRFRGQPERLREFLISDPEANSLLEDLHAFNDIPQAPTLPTSLQTTDPDSIINLLSRAMPEVVRPADEDREDEVSGGVRPPTPPAQPFLQSQADIVAVQQHIINIAGQRGFEGSEPLNERDIQAIVGQGISPERLQMLNELARMSYTSQVFRNMPEGAEVDPPDNPQLVSTPLDQLRDATGHYKNEPSESGYGSASNLTSHHSSGGSASASDTLSLSSMATQFSTPLDRIAELEEEDED